MPAFLGGVEFGEEDHIIGEVKGVALAYFLDVSEEWMVEVGDNWERKLLEQVANLSAIYAPDLQVSPIVVMRDVTCLKTPIVNVAKSTTKHLGQDLEMVWYLLI